MQNNSLSPVSLPLNSREATVELVGGKGCALAQLVRLDLPVPTGFYLTTIAYRRFTATNGIDQNCSR